MAYFDKQYTKALESFQRVEKKPQIRQSPALLHSPYLLFSEQTRRFAQI
ncbi:MAG: hypothetical protein IPL33_13285 [Sphingobacteriales bacterium]|nr:hypothetical protein [Sphingobacteriales bacterium]